MASLTLETILSEGGLMAGDSSLAATRGLVDMKQWLRSQAAGFDWPQIKREKSAIALAEGIQTLTFGNGVGGVTEQIQKINDPMKLYASDYSANQVIRIVTDWGDGDLPDNVRTNPATNRGAPGRARVRHSTTLDGSWDVIFDQAANKAYLIEMSYIIRPGDPATSDKPWYPNDLTLIHAAYVFVLKYKKDPMYRDELNILVSKVGEDRLKYGSLPGINDVLFLDPKTFR